jgi:DNA repair photolyase
MYPWITHTWNPIRGKCPHDCSYCYMKRIPNVGELRFVEKEMNTNLGKGNTIFVGSSTDMWARDIPYFWIKKTLEHCDKYYENLYVFQTKNPRRFAEDGNLLIWIKGFIGTTIETNREYDCSDNLYGYAPATFFRYKWMLKEFHKSLKKFISIEPIIDFDIQTMLAWMIDINPAFISIGADSGHNNLPEPPAWKVKKLIEELKQFTEVKLKSNLKRLLED